MKNYLLYIALFFCFMQQSHSQDGVVSFAIPVRNSLKFNKYVVNPTFSFVREQNKYVSFTNKREWAQFDNAPQTYLFSYSGRYSENTGVGVGLFQQNYGVLTTFGGVLNYAHNAVLDRDSNLTFGMNLGIYKSGINEGAVITNFPDPSLENIPSNTLISVNPGINYGTTFLDFGVSLNNIVLYNLKTSTLIEDNPNQSVQAHVMYTGYVDSRGFFDQSKFSGLIRSEFGKDQTIISGGMMLTIPKGIWAQAGYNTLYGVSGGIGFNISNQIAIEYNFEKAIGDLSTFGNSHEITLAYKFKKNERYNYSDDDDESALFTAAKKSRSVSAKRKGTSSTKVDRQAIAEAKAQVRAEALAKLETKKEARLKLLEEAKAKESTITQVKTEEEVKAKTNEEAKVKAEEEARITLEQELKAKEASKIKLAQEAKARAETEARIKLAQETKARADEEARVKLAEEEKAKEESKIKLAQVAKAEDEARVKLEQEAKARADEEAKAKLKQETQTKVVDVPMDATTKSMESLTKLAVDSKVIQEELITKLNETVTNREKDLQDLKQENDLSEQGIYTAPKPFKSVTAENAILESLKVQIDDVIKSQDIKIKELENLYKERVKNVPNVQDSINMIYLNEILILKTAQSKAKRSKETLVSELESIKIATEIERKRRIKRAAYDNVEDRYNKDRAVLNQIKQFTEVSTVPLKESDFDFGEEQSNIQIVKDVKNVGSGYYIVLAVHSDVAKRDDFLTKAVSAGESNINFFYDVNTSRYYIYYEKFDNISEAQKALETKGSKPYNGKMSMVKIEN